jgi:hypothetical protein
MEKNRILSTLGFTDEFLKTLEDHEKNIQEVHISDSFFDDPVEIESIELKDMIIVGNRTDSGTNITIKIV